MAMRSALRRVARTGLPAGLLAILIGAAAVADLRYVPPTRHMVINEAVVALAGHTVHLPLYFSDSGRYYAELLPDGAQDVPGGPAPGLAGVVLSVRISRDGEALFERAFSGGPPGEQTGTTILWLQVPGDLPQRRALDLALSFHGVPAALAGDRLRFQLTRKVELPPVRPF